MFQELWGHQNFENVVHFTLAEAPRKGDEAFSLFKDEFTAFFGLCMSRNKLSRNKFKSILRYICFADKNSRSLQRQTDKFAAIRKLWDSVMDNCQKS